MLSYVIPFLGVLTILVFIHELGHYLVARWYGVRVEVFSIGFGPELFGWTDGAKTRWKFSLIPLGGYVRMFGDEDAASKPDAGALKMLSEEEKQFSLHHKSLWARIMVSFAGPAANYLLAILLFIGLYTTAGKSYTTTEITKIVEDGPAHVAGMQVGDVITALNGESVTNFDALVRLIKDQARPNQPLNVTVRRSAPETSTAPGTLTLQVTPTFLGGVEGAASATDKADEVARESTEAPSLGRPIVGVAGKLAWGGPVGLGAAVRDAVYESYKFTVNTLVGIGQMLTGNRSSGELNGILRIAQLSGDMAESGIVPLLYFLAFLSLSLGLINLLPIPVLDGGHILMYCMEAIYGKPLPDRFVDWVFKGGLIIIIGLMSLALWNDIVQLRIVEYIMRLFS